MTDATKIMFIGLDSADPDLIREWSAEGALPNLKRLLDTGAWGPVLGTLFGTGAYWPSVFSGVNPARHGRYSSRQIVRGTYDTYRFTNSDIKRAPFWIALSRAGRRVAIIDVPHAPPSNDVNGMEICYWAMHDPVSPVVRTWPATLAAKIQVRFGSDPVNPCDAQNRRPEEFRELRERLLRRIVMKADLSSHYLAKGGWDLFMTVFGDSHCAGHQFWHIHEPSHPLHYPAMAASLGDPIKDIYVAIDDAVGRLVEQAGHNATVIVCAGPGMGPEYYSGNFLLDEILVRLEGRRATGGQKLFKAVKQTWRMLPTVLRRRIGPRLGDPVMERLLAPGRDKRKFYAVPHNSQTGGIRINLVGREPDGLVRAGEEYRRVCDQLTRDLLEVRSPETGAPIVKEVLHTADLYEGEYLEDLPDLHVVWNRAGPIFSATSSKVGTVAGTRMGYRTGDHTPDGMFLARGPKVTAGCAPEPVSAMDYAPTVAALLGVDLAGVDGRPISVIV